MVIPGAEMVSLALVGVLIISMDPDGAGMDGVGIISMALDMVSMVAGAGTLALETHGLVVVSIAHLSIVDMQDITGDLTEDTIEVVDI